MDINLSKAPHYNFKFSLVSLDLISYTITCEES